MLRSTRSRLIAASLVGALLLGAALLAAPVLLLMGATGSAPLNSSAAEGCLATGSVDSGSVRFGPDQLRNARTIVTTGEQLRVPRRGLVVALATALQESTLRNLPGGDRDSVGLFQQRGGWGSFGERTDPAVSATMFFTGGRAGQPGLLDIAGWASMPLTQAAQAVQRSAFPNAYARWEPAATGLVLKLARGEEVGCSDVSLTGLAGGAVGDMLRAALAQQGDPYVWGAVGPDAFDCSGLVVYAWQQAGYRVTARTAAQMWSAATPVAFGAERPGDLLFGEFGSRSAGPGHVMIVVRPGQTVQAPAAGRNVELTDYDASWAAGGWRLARLRPAALVRL